MIRGGPGLGGLSGAAGRKAALAAPTEPDDVRSYARHGLGAPLIAVKCVPASQVPAALAFVRAPEKPAPDISGHASSDSAHSARE